MTDQHYQADVVVVGGGLAGIVTALELLEKGKRVLLVEKDVEDKFGGLAKEAFGGICLVDTPHQRRLRIQDSPELAYRDWERYGEFGAHDEWPRRWARFYCEHSGELIFDYLDGHGIRFLPVVNWPERGQFQPGNSVPRWHITWGTGSEIVRKLVHALRAHSRSELFRVVFEHEVSALESEDGKITGVAGRHLSSGRAFRARGESVVIASGGICGGDLSAVRENWSSELGPSPAVLLNGSHQYADGLLHGKVRALGGNITHLDKQWHYAAGVHHPARRKAHDGLSLVPPRSALWLNARGERIGPSPLVGYTDTRFLVENILRQPGQYSWLLLNWKIAARELAVSGGDYMTAFRDKNKWEALRQLLFGNGKLVKRLLEECGGDIVAAKSLPELVMKMNERGLEGQEVELENVEQAVREYDEQIARGPAFFTDDQLRRIMSFRLYRGDRMRVCKYQKILDRSAMPLIVIRNFVLSRKSLGGIQTNLQCRVLRPDGSFIPGLYAVGEAAGFGGGGIHGKRSLEGTFLGSCVLSGRLAARAIAEEL